MAQKKRNNILDEECFGEGRRHFFLDLKKAKNQTHYLCITRSDALGDKKYNRSRLIMFEEDLEFFVEALTMILGRFTHSQKNNQINI